MDKNELQLQILQLTELQNICNEIIDMENPKQSDNELTKLLKKEYDLSKDDKDSILSIVLGKKKGESVSQKELDLLKKKCESYCMICEINPNDKNGEFIGYGKLKNKVSNRKSKYNKELEKMGE
ncbi:hypothetical protein CPG37_10845 [Malaciobacter canalis]|uniref:Uncharacterized protein n=1 Tax=Malaciobacter canalis TaxID=1912871 RepID=A0ABX4LMK6_9BACT|nr:hypothetical protein [Malaciobacter canalis]PHO09087.1 hypothetical protein CPG37_10845 [Malaciobacter canalis]QEE31809.1 hypothetical protein ACAN_0298 [Malaciobacter canalis]